MLDRKLRRAACTFDRPLSWDVRNPHRVTRTSRTAPSQLPVPHPGPSLGLALLSTALLLVALGAFGRMSGRPAGEAPSSWWDRVWLVIQLVLHGLAKTVFGGPRPERWAQLGVLILVGCTFFTWRRWRQDWYVYLPGPVNVRTFDDAAGTDQGRSVYLRSRFCRQLAETSVYPPYSGPADPPPDGFFDVLAKEQGDLSNAPSFLPRVLAALWPRQAYQISGTLQRRKVEPRYGLSVTVTSFLGRTGSATTTYWGNSWEDATCKAAYWAMAKIVPVTRLAKTPPWRKWRGRDMPAELFEAYNEAKKRHDDLKLDDALWWYREALRLDPFNLDIRLMVGSVQEDLGLFLDALQTYQGALAVGQLEAHYTGALWSRKRRRLRRPLRYTGATVRQLRRHPEWIKLRFQYARTLGYAERVMAQWLPHNPGAKLDANTPYHWESRQNRERLCAALAERYWPAVLTCTGAGTRDEAKQLVREMLRHRSSAPVVLHLAAWQEFHRLYEDLTIAAFVPGAGAGFDRRLVRLMRDVWAPLRLMRTLHDARYDSPEGSRLELPAVGCLSDWWIWWRRRKADRALGIGWPASPMLLGDAIFAAQRRWNRAARLGYLDYYHAGCLYAFALQGYPLTAGTGPSAERAPVDRAAETLTYRAVENLREALMCTESGRAGRLTVQSDTQAGTASRLRTWIATSDPDLARLRNRAEFRFFQQDAYQPMKPVPLRPEDVSEVRVVAYAKNLLCEGARLLERHWHRQRLRRRQPRYLHDLVLWLRLDDRTWEVVERIALDGARYWADRAEFSRLVTRTVALQRTTGHHFPPPVPVYDDLRLDEVERLTDDQIQLPWVVDDAVARQVERIDRCLARLLQLARAAKATAHRSDQLLRQLDVDDVDLSSEDYTWICMARAALWQEVIELLDDTDLVVDATAPEDEQTEP
ncbi:tetratricopeptide repeat protein [Micromonospora mangrovi]|uniref:Tetratricopeptide repeat protein n=2 Tax=Micromonospora TaxID=1873 RepID=A0AAU8H7U8_9ACTN